MFLPSNPPLPTQETASPLPTPEATSSGSLPRHNAATNVIAEDQAMSDTTSIRSSHTQRSLSGFAPHPELHEPGLNASIIETVNMWFSDGSAPKSLVVGELALAYIPSSLKTLSRKVRVRLDNFEVLEKVACNPYFVAEASAPEDKDEKKGEYTVQLPNISRSTPSVAFKYQVHADQASASLYCPVVFKPAWNIEETQASVIVQYSLDPSFVSTLASPSSITVKNLVLTVGLDISAETGGAHAASAVMYPTTGAAFRRKQSSVLWKIPELEIKPDAGGKFLVRFTTSAAGKSPRKGKVEAKFEVEIPNNAGKRLAVYAASEQEAEQKGSDPFADEPAEARPTGATWDSIPTVHRLVVRDHIAP